MERSGSGVTGATTETWTRLIPPALRNPQRLALFAIACALAIWSLYQGAVGTRTSGSAVLPGFAYTHRLTVDPPLSNEAIAGGVSIRDRIISIDGQELRSGRDLYDRLKARRPGDRVRLELADRAGKKYQAALTTAPGSAVTAAGGLVIGGLYILSALVVLWFHGGRRHGWSFALGCIALGTFVIILGVEPQPAHELAVTRIAIAMWGLSGAALLHFVAIFPRPVPVVQRFPSSPLALELFMFAVGIVAAYSISPGSDGHLIPMRVIAGGNTACAIGGVAILVWRSRRPQPARDAARFRLLILAIVVAFSVPAVVGVLRVARLWIPPTAGARVAIMLTLAAFPILVGYAVAKYNLLDLDKAAAKAAAYSGAMVAVGATYVVLVVLVPTRLAPTVLATSPTAMALSVVAAVGILWPVKRSLETMTTRFFRHPEIEAGIDDVRSLITSALANRNTEHFARVERRMESSFRITPIEIYLCDADDRWRRPATGDTRTQAPEAPVVYFVGPETAPLGAVVAGHPGQKLVLGSSERGALREVADEIAGALSASPAGEYIGRYRIDRFLAAGGMGNVYIATKEGAQGFAKKVALKRLLPEAALTPDVVDRFVTEARVVARLSHPNIVQTYELDETDYGYYIAMEYVEGVDAWSLIRSMRKTFDTLPIALAANIATKVCLALEHAHAATDDSGVPMRLIHRDVTPHNVLLSTAGAVKLADFGVAHVKGRPSDRNKLVGKTAYLAPEQLRGAPLDHRVDIFATGILLYELLTGEHPFRHPTSRQETWDAIERGRFLSPTTLRGDVPHAMAAIIDRALSPEVDKRYQTASAMAEALEALYPLESRNTRELGAIVRAAMGHASEVPKRGTTETLAMGRPKKS